MRSKFGIPTLLGISVAATMLIPPASAQYQPVYGPAYRGPIAYGPAYRTRVFRGAYAQGPVIGPLYYNDGWVPESVFDHSRPGGRDPYLNPAAN
jgi:hypothetical protein